VGCDQDLLSEVLDTTSGLKFVVVSYKLPELLSVNLVTTEESHAMCRKLALLLTSAEKNT
jgi:hypothetical protein